MHFLHWLCMFPLQLGVCHTVGKSVFNREARSHSPVGNRSPVAREAKCGVIFCTESPQRGCASSSCLSLSSKGPFGGFSQQAGKRALKWHPSLAAAGEAFVLFFSCCIKVFVFLSL